MNNISRNLYEHVLSLQTEADNMADTSLAAALITAAIALAGFTASSIKDIISYQNKKQKHQIEEQRLKNETDQKRIANQRLAYYKFIQVFSTSGKNMLDYLNAALGVLEYGNLKFVDPIVFNPQREVILNRVLSPPLIMEQKEPTKIDNLVTIITFMISFRAATSDKENDKEVIDVVNEIRSDMVLALTPILMGILSGDKSAIKMIQSTLP
jgi:hypothetical protein